LRSWKAQHLRFSKDFGGINRVTGNSKQLSMKNPSAFGDHGPPWSPWSIFRSKNKFSAGCGCFSIEKNGKLSRLGMTSVEDDRFIPTYPKRTAGDGDK